MITIKHYFTTTMISLALVFGACNNKSGSDSPEQIDTEIVNNPASAQDGASTEGAVPVFSFEKETHDFGQIMQGEKVTYAFKFKNTGDAPLVISSANATCGCTVPEYTKTPVQPGEEGFITVTFDSSGKSGMTSKNVTLISNAIPNTKVLTVSADIQVPQQTN